MKKIISLVFALSVAFLATASDLWSLKTDVSDSDYYGVGVANGGIGIIPWNSPFCIERVHLNQIYDTGGPFGVSSAINGMNPFQIGMTIDGRPVSDYRIKEFRQELDMRHAVHKSTFTIPGKAEIRYDVRALRQLAYVGMVVVEVKALHDIDVEFSSSIENLESQYTDFVYGKPVINIEGRRITINKAFANTINTHKKVCVASCFISETDDFNDCTAVSTTIKKGCSYRIALVASQVCSFNVNDPYNESDRELSLVRHQGIDASITRHEALWDELWKGDIEIEGDDDAQATVRLALYNLYSSCRSGSRLSIPPFGLTTNGYNGHVFWDTEMWMYPPMLFLNSGIAESMMNYRTDRLRSAEKRASMYGYEGAMFPWESDYEGVEGCPTFALCGVLEHHITGDVPIAVWNYYCMTHDKDWLKDSGWPLLRECARFWVSRVSCNDDGTYSIVDVSGADEYAVGVTDNAFTNGVAICALKAAVKAADVLGYKAPAEWAVIADGIRIINGDGITLEYEGYDGGTVKQADANLLAYPLQIITDNEQIRRDLKFYESVIDSRGPAMSFAILALQYARIGDGEKAYELFHRAYQPNRLPPFGALAEGAGGTNPYFCTGAGGLLQTVINGFCGLELTDDGIVQLPSALPPTWKSVTVKGVGPDRKTYTNSRE